MTYDLTHWIYARHIDCMDTPAIHANDNGYEEWQDWFHVKSWATDSVYEIYLTGERKPKRPILEVVK